MNIWSVFRTFYGFILRKRKGLFVLFLFLVVVSNIAPNLNPYFYRLFVEEIPNLNFEFLLKLLFIFIGIRILGVILDLFAFIVGDFILFGGAKDARIRIFKHVQDLDFAFHMDKSTGSLISAFKRGDGAFFSFFHDIHARVASVVIGFLVMLFFLIQLDLLMVILVAASMIVTIIAAKFLVANNVAKRRVFNKQEDEISGIITDNLINFETVKLFAKEKWETRRLKLAFIPWTKALWGYANSFRAIDATMGAVINISIFLILLVSIRQAVSLNLTIGDFVLVTSFIGTFFPKLWELVWSTRDLAKNYADIEKYFELLNFSVEVPNPKKPKKLANVRGLIEFVNINHSYKSGTKNAVKNFNLKIDPGESVAFVGKSGSGKTTITKLLMRFFDPEKGKILIDGVDIRKLNKEDLRDLFGTVPQEPVLFNNTIAFNIGYGAKKTAGVKEIKEASKLANIDAFIQKLPKKYETNVGERGIKLSGGQKQRLAIARMILSEPNIVIFDEATSHLDSESEKLIQDAFWKATRDKTTIIIAHRLSTIMKADRIVVMEKGEIKEIGTHSDLVKNKNGIYKHLWDLQIKDY